VTEVTLLAAWRALAPIADQLVVVGGAAHRLFARHPLATEIDHGPLTTEDVDIAAPIELAHPKSLELHERMIAAGFASELRGAETAVQIYRHRNDRDVYLQFIAHRRGDGVRRDGSPDRSINMQGIEVQKISHVDILLARPWRLLIHEGGSTASVSIVHPIDFMYQKLLIRSARQGYKRAKDCLYVHDTLLMFARQAEELVSTAPSLHHPASKSEMRDAKRSFAIMTDEKSDLVRDAIRFARTQRENVPSGADFVDTIARQLPRFVTMLRD